MGVLARADARFAAVQVCPRGEGGPNRSRPTPAAHRGRLATRPPMDLPPMITGPWAASTPPAGGKPAISAGDQALLCGRSTAAGPCRRIQSLPPALIRQTKAMAAMKDYPWARRAWASRRWLAPYRCHQPTEGFRNQPWPEGNLTSPCPRRTTPIKLAPGDDLRLRLEQLARETSLRFLLGVVGNLSRAAFQCLGHLNPR